MKVKVLSKQELSYAHAGDAGFDLKASEDIIIAPHKTGLVKTGTYFQIPENTQLEIRSRSGLALKKSVFVLNSPGTVDSGYRNEVGVIIHNAGDSAFEVKKGDRIAQAVLMPYIKAEFEYVSSEDELQESDRNKNGFGSTGI